MWLIFHEDQTALRRRPAAGLLAGLWEFPNELGGGSLPAEWGIAALSEDRAGQAKHIFTHIEWRMTLRRVEAASDALPEGWVWADGRELEREYTVPSAFERGLELAKERLNGGK